MSDEDLDGREHQYYLAPPGNIGRRWGYRDDSSYGEAAQYCWFVDSQDRICYHWQQVDPNEDIDEASMYSFEELVKMAADPEDELVEGPPPCPPDAVPPEGL